MRIETEGSQPGYVVLTEAVAPGWSATIDGAAAPLLAANFVFRAVAVPAGRHVIDLNYDAPGFRLGLLASLAGLALAALLIARAATSVRRAEVRAASRAALVVGGLLAVSLAATIAGFAPHPPF